MLTNNELRQLKRAGARKHSPALNTLRAHYQELYSPEEVKTSCICGSCLIDLVIIPKMIAVILGDVRRDSERLGFLELCGFNVVYSREVDVLRSPTEVLMAIDLLPDVEDSEKKFRSALGRGNAYRGMAVQRERKIQGHPALDI